MEARMILFAFFLSFIAAYLATPAVRRLAIMAGAVDKPDNLRKSHKEPKPSLGGLAIFFGAAMGLIFLSPIYVYIDAAILGAFMIVVTGLLDDMFNLKPYQKLLGQALAAVIVISSGMVIETLTLPFLGTVNLGLWGYGITMIWIVGASNAINLIDGLDGLASGVSAIALARILVMAVMDGQILVISLCSVLIGAILGFLPHNFYPARIFMGDTGALFLGYSIAIVSMLGLFKNVAFFSFIVPIIVMAVPIFDTMQAMIRRIINRQAITTADHKHIHYKLMERGYSHRTTVLIIYGFSAFFGLMAIIFNSATLLSSLVIFVIIIFGIRLIAEFTGMTYHNRKPLLKWISKWLPLDKKRVDRSNHP